MQGEHPHSFSHPTFNPAAHATTTAGHGNTVLHDRSSCLPGSSTAVFSTEEPSSSTVLTVAHGATAIPPNQQGVLHNGTQSAPASSLVLTADHVIGSILQSASMPTEGGVGSSNAGSMSYEAVADELQRLRRLVIEQQHAFAEELQLQRYMIHQVPGRIMNHLVMVMGTPTDEQQRMLEQTTEQWNQKYRWNI